MRPHLLLAVVLRLALFLSSVALAMPLDASAQGVAGSLAELREQTLIGQTLVITDAAGRRVRGKLREISEESLTLESGGASRRFSSLEVRLVQKPDPLWQGMLVGAAVGAGLATWDYLIDPSEPGNAAVYALSIGVGTAVGAGIDAMIGTKTLFAPRHQTQGRPGISFYPVLAARRQGMALSVQVLSHLAVRTDWSGAP